MAHSTSSSRYPTGAPAITFAALFPYNDAKQSAPVLCDYPLLEKRGCPPCAKHCASPKERSAHRCKLHLGWPDVQQLVEVERQAARAREYEIQRAAYVRWLTRMQQESDKLHKKADTTARLQAKAGGAPALPMASPFPALPAPMDVDEDEEDDEPFRSHRRVSGPSEPRYHPDDETGYLGRGAGIFHPSELPAEDDESDGIDIMD